MAEAAGDPRMYAKQIEHHKVFNAVGGEMVAYFDLIGSVNSSFGTIRGSLQNLDSPRYRALIDLANMEPEPITFGTLAPFVRDGKEFDIINNFGSPPSTGIQTLSETGVYFTGYAFRVPSDGDYTVAVEYSTTADAAFDIEYDGSVVGSFDVPDTDGVAQTTALTTFASTANALHAIRLVATTGDVSVHTLAVDSVE